MVPSCWKERNCGRGRIQARLHSAYKESSYSESGTAMGHRLYCRSRIAAPRDGGEIRVNEAWHVSVCVNRDMVYRYSVETWLWAMSYNINFSCVSYCKPLSVARHFSIQGYKIGE
jgi:hypothetical protein